MGGKPKNSFADERRLLRQHFPAAFVDRDRRSLPLKLGTHRDITDRLGRQTYDANSGAGVYASSVWCSPRHSQADEPSRLGSLRSNVMFVRPLS
jgi:hypothetical protein